MPLSGGLVLVWGQGGNAEGLLLAIAAGAGGGVGPHSLSSPWTGLKSLLGWHTPKPCGSQPWHLKHWREMGSFHNRSASLAIIWTLGHSVPGLDLWSLCPDWQICCRLRHGLTQASLTIVGAGAARSVPVHLSFCHSLSVWGYCWGTSRDTALSCSGQGSHQLGYLIPQLCSALNRFSGHWLT